MIVPDAGFIYNIRKAHFITNVNGDCSQTFDGNLFVMLLMAVDGQADIGDTSNRYLKISACRGKSYE